MLHCPKCRAEYDVDVGECADCGEKLVEGPAPPSSGRGGLPETAEDRSASQPVALCTVVGEIQARLVQDALAEQGIYSFARAESVAHAAFYLPFIGVDDPLTIYVAGRKLPEARQVLEDVRRERPDGEVHLD